MPISPCLGIKKTPLMGTLRFAHPTSDIARRHVYTPFSVVARMQCERNPGKRNQTLMLSRIALRFIRATVLFRAAFISL